MDQISVGLLILMAGNYILYNLSNAILGKLNIPKYFKISKRHNFISAMTKYLFIYHYS